jgi:hypothetical protein
MAANLPTCAATCNYIYSNNTSTIYEGVSILPAFLLREARKLFGICFILISRVECWFSMIYDRFPWLHVWLQPRPRNNGYRDGVDEVEFQRMGKRQEDRAIYSKNCAGGGGFQTF